MQDTRVNFRHVKSFHIMLNHVKSRCSVVESYFSLVSILHGTTFTRYVCHAFVR